MLNCNLPPRFTTRRSLRLAIFLSCTLFALNGFADVTFTAVAPFRGTNGAQPYGTLVRGTSGLFYGTTARGGDFDQGVVFTATTSGQIAPLVSFDGPSGAQPLVGLTLAPDGLFYGAASSGGEFGFGTLFSVTPDGLLTNRFSFDGTNGARPLSPLLLGVDGNFYGTTSLGGSFNQGTTFMFSPTSGIVSVFSFAGTNGAQPSGALAQGSDGTLYGTTSAGGVSGYGTVYSRPPAGMATTLASFSGGADGAGPQGGLIFGTDGNLYGTTAAGGTNNAIGGRNGTVFRISPAGTFATIHRFVPGEGANPFATLFQNGSGVFYGTTTADGAHGLGSVFSFGLSGGFTNLHSFIRNEGISPQAGFAAGTNGNLFSVASSGGRFRMGTLFQLSGLSPFIIVAPTNQTVGAGSNVSFTVLAGGSAPFTFQWLFNSNNLANGRVVSGARTSTLTLTSVTPQNSGSYTVLVQNQAGQVLSVAAKLNVIPNPSIHITSPRSGTAVKDQEVTVAGTASGDALVARVYYRLNDSEWQLASSSDNWAHWKAIVSVVTGTNTVDAFAESAIGTYSKTNSVVFFSPPFVPIIGTYAGLFGVPDSFAPDSSGFFSLTLNFNGAFSGAIQMAGTRASFSGQFDSNGDASVNIARSHQTPLTASLHLELAAPDNRVTGTITDGAWVADVLANRSTFDSRTNAAPVAGRYAFNIPGSTNASSAPGGDSFGTLTVSAAGKIVANVSLGDNTHFTQNVPLAQDGTFPFFAPLYGGKGIILGWLSFTNPAPSILNGDVNWYKPSVPSRYYSAGFTISSAASGGLYVPTNAIGVLNATNVQVILTGGDLSDTITNLVAIDTRNHVTDLTGNHLTLTSSSSTGTFKGSLIDPVSGRKLPFFGVMREDLGIGDGFFLGTTLSGEMLIEP